MQGDKSFVATSCAFTAKVASARDKRQKQVKKPYTLPPPTTRELDAKLILEEALETVHALGFNVVQKLILKDGLLPELQMIMELVPHNKKPDLEKIIDGCCDTIYVATGALTRMQVSDNTHLEEVCKANDSKFPDGKAIIDKASGKYLKPPGWKPPDHKKYFPKKERKRATKRK